MKEHSDIISNFGRNVVVYARDLTIKSMSEILEKSANSPFSKELANKMEELKFSEEQKKFIKALTLNSVDSAITDLIKVLREHKNKYKLVAKCKDGTQFDIDQEGSNDLCQKLKESIDKYSKYHIAKELFESENRTISSEIYKEKRLPSDIPDSLLDKLTDVIMQSSDISRFRLFKHLVASGPQFVVLKQDNGDFFLDQTSDGRNVLMVWPRGKFTEIFFKNSPEIKSLLSPVHIDDFIKNILPIVKENNAELLVFPGTNHTGKVCSVDHLESMLKYELAYYRNWVNWDTDKIIEAVVNADLISRISFFKHKVADVERLYFLQTQAGFCLDEDGIQEKDELFILWPFKEFAEISLKNHQEYLSQLKEISIYDFLNQYMNYIKMNDIKLMVCPGITMDGGWFDADNFENMIKDELSYCNDWENWKQEKEVKKIETAG